MRLTRRIAKLERMPRYRREPCRACGTIDFETGTGTYRPGYLFCQDEQGCWICMCKLCAREFKARLTPNSDGSYAVTGARPLKPGEGVI